MQPSSAMHGDFAVSGRKVQLGRGGGGSGAGQVDSMQMGLLLVGF